MSQVLLICASPRPGSNSSKTTEYLRGIISAKGHQVDVKTFLGLEIRSIGAGYIQPAEVTAFQQAILDAIIKADHVIWVVPEYNRNMPAEMIAFLEHFGNKTYPALWNDRVHAIVGVSSGIGGREPIYQLMKMFSYVIDNYGGHNCYISPHSFQSINTGEQFDAQNNFIGDERFAANATKFVTKLLGE